MKRSIVSYNEKRKTSKDRTRDELEFEKHKQEYTFKPKISEYVFSTPLEERRERAQAKAK